MSTQNTRTRKRRTRIRAFAGMLITSLALGGIIIASSWKPNTEKLPARNVVRTQTKTAPTFDATQAREYQERIRRDTLHSLGSMAITPRTKELYEFLKKNAFYSIPRGPRATMILSEPGEDPAKLLARHNNANAFEIVFMPPEYARIMQSPVLWEREENIMRIAAQFSSPKWLAIIIYHELEHVWSSKQGIRHAFGSNEWYAEEAYAHLQECDHIKAWRPSEYATLMLVDDSLTPGQRAFWEKEKEIFSDTARFSGSERALVDAALSMCKALEIGKRKKEAPLDTYRRLFHSSMRQR